MFTVYTAYLPCPCVCTFGLSLSTTLVPSSALPMTKFYPSFKSQPKPTSSQKASLMTPTRLPLSLYFLQFKLFLWTCSLSKTQFVHLWMRPRWCLSWSPKLTSIKTIEKSGKVCEVTLNSLSTDIIKYCWVDLLAYSWLFLIQIVQAFLIN